MDISLLAHEMHGPLSLLSEYETRLTELPEHFWTHIDESRRTAVSAGDEVGAKRVWCLEQVGKFQDEFIRSFCHLRADEFYAAWCALERSEITLGFLIEHVGLQRAFGIAHAAEHIPRFQGLFPYKVFFSPGFVIKEARCSICDQPFRLRGGCGHQVGEVYGGHMCVRNIASADMLEISLVNHPVQKYSVAFPEGVRFNYGAVKYLIDSLASPWHAWTYGRTLVDTGRPIYSGVGRNERCACRSGRKFKYCCSGKTVQQPHYELIFAEEPPNGFAAPISNVEYYVEETGIGMRTSAAELVPPNGPEHS